MTAQAVVCSADARADSARSYAASSAPAVRLSTRARRALASAPRMMVRLAGGRCVVVRKRCFHLRTLRQPDFVFQRGGNALRRRCCARTIHTHHFSLLRALDALNGCEQ
jgi:hypothetical protein